MKPPYIRLYVKDFSFDTQGMTDSQLGRYMRKAINFYKTGEISPELEKESLFFSINTSFHKYLTVCERNKQNRNKSKGYSDQSSTSGKPVVNQKSTITNNHKPVTNNQEEESNISPIIPLTKKPEKKHVRRSIEGLRELPTDWNYHQKHSEKCLSYGFSTGELAENFKNYHKSKGSKFKDWDSAFFTWINNQKTFKERDNVKKQTGHRQAGSNGFN